MVYLPAQAATLLSSRAIRKPASSIHMRCRITPIRRATATVARFCPRRLATCIPQAFSQQGLARCISTVAALNNAVRSVASPAFVIGPTISRSPDCSRRGVSPAQGPTAREERNRLGSSMAARTVSATKAPTPGIVIMSRDAWSCRARSRNCRSTPASSCRSLSRAPKTACDVARA